MIKFKTSKLIERLPDSDLECFVAGGELSPKAKQILKWIGIGTAGAAVLAGAGVGVAAIVGWKTGKGNFGYLHDEFADIPYDENIEISRPYNFRHYLPPPSEGNIIIQAVKSVYENIRSMEFTENGPRLF